AAEGFADVLLVVDHAEKHDGRARSGVLELAKGLEAVESRHVDVEHDDVRLDDAGDVERLPTVGRDAGDVEFGPEHRGDTAEHSAVVVDEQDFRPGSAGSRETRQTTRHCRSISRYAIDTNLKEQRPT